MEKSRKELEKVSGIMASFYQALCPLIRDFLWLN